MQLAKFKCNYYHINDNKNDNKYTYATYGSLMVIALLYVLLVFVLLIRYEKIQKSNWGTFK